VRDMGGNFVMRKDVACEIVMCNVRVGSGVQKV